jgi:hypothetical protein
MFFGNPKLKPAPEELAATAVKIRMHFAEYPAKT